MKANYWDVTVDANRHSGLPRLYSSRLDIFGGGGGGSTAAACIRVWLEPGQMDDVFTKRAMSSVLFKNKALGRGVYPHT